jgi:hypothetical protein
MPRLIAALRLSVLTLSAMALLAPSAAAQQLWFAQNDDTTYGSFAVGWPASVLGFRFTAPGNATITGAQVFTGNTAPSPHTLELRAHDGITGLPGALLGPAGTWTTLHTRCWQGPTLQPVALTGGQDYWLVWRVTGMFPQHSVSADSATNTLSEVRVSDGNSWHAQATLAAKFRLFSDYPPGFTIQYGTAKPGTYGDPTMGLSGWPAVGNPLDLWLDNCVRRQPAFLLFGSAVFAGIALPIGISWTTVDQAIFIPQTVTQSSPFVGGATLTLMVPNDPWFAGQSVAFQWAILDPVAADGIAHTDAVLAVLL